MLYLLYKYLSSYSNIPNYNNEDDAFSSSNKNFTINRNPRGARVRLRRTQTAHNLNVSKKSFELKRAQETSFNTSISEENKQNRIGVDSKPAFASSTKESPSHTSLSRPITINGNRGNSNPNSGGVPMYSPSLSRTNDCQSLDTKDLVGNFKADNEKGNLKSGGLNMTKQPPQLQHSLSTISNETLIVGANRFKIGRRASTVSKTEVRQREAMWDLFQSENAFLIDHLMVIKHVSSILW